MNDESEKIFFFPVSEEAQGQRLDIFLVSSSLGLSRARAQTLIKNGQVTVNEKPSRPSYRLKRGDGIDVLLPPASPIEGLKPEPVDFTIVYEDESLLVLDKPAGIVVHPAPGHPTGTLVHGLLHHCKNLAGIGGQLRPGIVHRLDKDTSGLIVVAKSDRIHRALSRQFKAGHVKKEYVALVHGHLKGEEGAIDLPIARHPKKRKRMSVARIGGRKALSVWEKMECFQIGFSLISISLKTGRTHQIRVHFSHIGHPVVGDPVYGYGKNWWKRTPKLPKEIGGAIQRQMLHARRLGFLHPDRQNFVEFTAHFPDDMIYVLQALRRIETMNSSSFSHKTLDI